MAELLMMRLEGVLQSWGENSKWNNRGTSSFPSKSAVTGLIACAMGLERGDKGIVDLEEGIHIGVRADRSGTLIEDFHTVQGMPFLYDAEGTKRNSDTIVTRRGYLSDASFLVVVEGEHDLLIRIIPLEIQTIARKRRIRSPRE